MRILVAGGAGFIGSNFIRHWAERHTSDEILNFDLLTYAGDRGSLADIERLDPQRYRFVQGDIADPIAVKAAFDEHHPDLVVNFAAESHNSRAVIDPTVFLRTNVIGVQVLLEACRTSEVRRFHHISTCEVYGDLPLDSPASFAESSPYRPRTPYNASKAAADHVVRAYHETFGVPITISNCANNYGPFQHPEKVVPLFTTNALDDRALPLYSLSQHRREWIHVRDHCAAIEAVITRGRAGETYNVGTGDERSIEGIADAILSILGRPSTLKTYVADRPGHDRRYLLDHRKIEKELGWRPTITFEDGLRATVEWYRQHEQWWRPKKVARGIDETRWASVSTIQG